MKKEEKKEVMKERYVANESIACSGGKETWRKLSVFPCGSPPQRTGKGRYERSDDVMSTLC
jgi:hypothetical protein